MSSGPNSSLVNVDLGNLSKPANTLIKKVADAVGAIGGPGYKVRMAKAEAQVALIKAQSEIDVSDLQRRALQRLMEEEAKKQKNIEAITYQAIPLLDEMTDAEKMNNDWVTNFFDKSRIVSEEEMQLLWAKVLAGEANKPGTYSKRTVNFLSTMDRTDADLFTDLCGFLWWIGYYTPLIFDFRANIYKDNGITVNALIHLESIGLIQFERSMGFRQECLPKHVEFTYHGQPLRLEMPKNRDNDLSIGSVVLTTVGLELAPLCESKPVESFFDYVKEKWRAYIPNSDASRSN